MTYISEAFHKICDESRKPGKYFVCLMERTSYYGGPEEGGWWGHDRILQKYQEYPTIEQAEEAKEKIEKFAEELTIQARRDFGDHCKMELEWLDARGLDADYLPEPDGPSEYFVVVTEHVPDNYYGPRHYE